MPRKIDPKALAPIYAAIAGFKPSEFDGISIPETKLCLDRFGLSDTEEIPEEAVIVPELETVWAEVGDKLPARELLSLEVRGLDIWIVGVCAHELPDGRTIYSAYDHSGGYLIACDPGADDEAHFRFLEAVLASNGERFDLEIMCSAPHIVRSVFSVAELAPLFVQAFDCHGGLPAWEDVEELAGEAEPEEFDLHDLFVDPVSPEEREAKMADLKKRYPRTSSFLGSEAGWAYGEWLDKEGKRPYIPVEGQAEANRRRQALAAWQQAYRSRAVESYLEHVMQKGKRRRGSG